MARTGQLETRLRALLDERVSHAPPRRMTSLLLVSLAMLSSLPAAAITLELAHAPARWLAGPEPDTLGDALATPESERLPPATSVARPDTARLFAGPDSALARSLVAALGHEPTHAADLVRDRARWALGRARDGRLVEPLLEALAHPDWRARSYAAWALAVAGDERAVPRLIELLSDPVWRMRAMAAAALRASGDPRAEAAMRAALTDPAWQVRMEAVEYFAALDGPGMRERLAPRLEDRHVAVRQAAERAFSH
jgi:HEAT repeat protein